MLVLPALVPLLRKMIWPQPGSRVMRRAALMAGYCRRCDQCLSGGQLRGGREVYGSNKMRHSLRSIAAYTSPVLTLPWVASSTAWVRAARTVRPGRPAACATGRHRPSATGSTTA